MHSDLLQQMVNQKHIDQLHRNANNERLANIAIRAQRRHLGSRIVSIVVSSLQAFSIKQTAQTPSVRQTAEIDIRDTAEISALS